MATSKKASDINRSFKWSMVTEVCVKLMSPVINAILARILTPEEFAPLTTILMIISFGEIFVESGFKKYLIQHQFDSDDSYQKSFAVAMWSNLMMSFVIWMGLLIFAKPLAAFLGNADIWLAICISGVMLPMYGVIGIFSAQLQKELKFNKLFVVRVITASIPLVVTIPLALLGLGYWSLIIGNIASVGAQMCVLMIVSKSKIRFFYSFSILKRMWSNSMWTILDGIFTWMVAWVDSLIIARYMSDYYLGMYKNVQSMVTSLFSIVTAALLPVLFVGLSRYQKDDEKFSTFFNSTQRKLAIILIPLSVGVFLYRDLAVSILFGDKWAEASDILGISALATAFRTIFISICSDAYRAKGKFQVPFFLQCVDVCILIPVCLISVKYGFWHLVYARSLVKLVMILPNAVLLKTLLRVNVASQIRPMSMILIGTLLMGCCCCGLQMVSSAMWWDFLSIFLAVLIYFAFVLAVPSLRSDLGELPLFSKLIKREKKHD